MQLKEGNIFDNRYRLIKLLGRGGFSEVWLVEDTEADNLKMALKIYAPGTGLDEDGVQLFRREFALVCNLNHSNLLRPFHFAVCDRKPYLVLPYCERKSAQKIIGKMTEEEAWQFLHDVASGLAYLHAQNPPIIHQDIKPENVLIDLNGHYLITDFGISAKARSTLRQSLAETKSHKTPAYTPPERFGKDNTFIMASDVWSLGATMYELLTDDAPFDEDGGSRQNIGAEVPNISGKWSSDLKEITTRCLQKDTEDRPTAVQLVKWTEAHFNGNPINFRGGKTFRIPKKVIYSVFIALMLMTGCWFLWKKMQPQVLPCSFVPPELTFGQKAAIVNLDGDERGKVSIYVIDRDKNENWKSNKDTFYNYRPDSKDSVKTFIYNNLEYRGLKERTLYVFNNNHRKSKAYIESLLDSSQKLRLEEWNKEKEKEIEIEIEYLYLYHALVSADFRHNSCMLHIEQNRTIFLWLTVNGRFGICTIPDLGYDRDRKPDIEQFARIIERIPSENREYFFTSGYGILNMDTYLSKDFADNFIAVNDIVSHQLSESGDFKRVCDIYKTLAAAAKTNCFFYRKGVYPEIGYLLKNER